MTASIAALRPDLKAVAANGRRAPQLRRPEFKPSIVAERLRAQSPIAVGGEALFAYTHGVYRANGETLARRWLVGELGEDWKKGKADEVVAYLRDSSPPLLERSPLEVINCANGLLGRSETWE